MIQMLTVRNGRCWLVQMFRWLSDVERESESWHSAWPRSTDTHAAGSRMSWCCTQQPGDELSALFTAVACCFQYSPGAETTGVKRRSKIPLSVAYKQSKS